MTVSTGQLDVGKQKVVLFITGVSAKDQPGEERELFEIFPDSLWVL